MPAAAVPNNTAPRSASSKKPSESSRYAATVEKGDNAWKREWGGFISGVKMTDGGQAVKLPSCMDYEKQEASSFSYLFSSPAQKKQERMKKKAALDAEKNRKKKERELKKLKAAQERGEKVDVDWDDPFHELSAHKRAMLEAQRRGLLLEGMSRKEVREFLHLTISKEQQEAQAHQRELKPHELMDEALQWYQQGPYPLDVISEKLVIKKALKHAKQQGMKYNYLTVHPSWVASRARKRKEGHLDAWGTRVSFDESGEVVEKDKLRALQIASRKSYMETHEISGAVTADRTEASSSTDGAPAAPVPQLSTTGKSAIVGTEAFRKQLLMANLTTNFMGSGLVQGPSIGLDDIAAIREQRLTAHHAVSQAPSFRMQEKPQLREKRSRDASSGGDAARKPRHEKDGAAVSGKNKPPLQERSVLIKKIKKIAA